MTTDPPKASKSGRWQFSLRTLFFIMTYVAIVCVAIVYSESSSVIPAFSGAVFVAMFTVVAFTFQHKGARRWFGLGFLLAGASSTVLLPIIVGGVFRVARPSSISDYPHFVELLLVSCWSAALPIAFLGGLLARYFYSTRADE